MAQTAATSMERTWASLLKPAAYVASPSVANTTATSMVPAQRLCTEYLLKDFLENPYEWDKEQFKRVCQNVLRLLIGEVADLELKGITRGRLTGENILVIGSKDKNLKLKILDTPHGYEPGMQCYFEEFRTLALKVVHPWKATCSLESRHFLEMLEYCMPRCDFKQLQWHPLLLSSKERAMFVIHTYVHLDIEQKGWKEDYKKVIPIRNVDFRKTLFRKGFFYDVYVFKRVKYQPNALGALMFYRNALFHVNDCIYKAHKQHQVNQQQIEAALLTTEQKENELARFFPEVVLELFNYMFEKGIDINAVI